MRCGKGVATALLSLLVLLAGCRSNGVAVRKVSGQSPVVAAPVEKKVVPPSGGDSPDAPVAGLPALDEVEPLARGEMITIQRDCQVSVTVKEDPNLNGTYAVNEYGAIQLGYIGPVILINKTEREAEKKIKDTLLSRSFKVATVKVEIQKASYDNVLVTGGVHSGGLIKIGAGDSVSLNDALLRAGGVSVPISTAKVRVIRGGRLSAVALALSGEIHSLTDAEGAPFVPMVQLRNNDVAYVYSEQVAGAVMDAGTGGSQKTVLVLGEVIRSGFISFSGQESATMMNLVFKMGGFPPYANDKAIKIIRRDKAGNETETVVNARRIMENGDPDLDVPLENGDRIVVGGRRITLF
jgi:protein involved in polysaccharide export with SLBB domain